MEQREAYICRVLSVILRPIYVGDDYLDWVNFQA